MLQWEGPAQGGMLPNLYPVRRPTVDVMVETRKKCFFLIEGGVKILSFLTGFTKRFLRFLMGKVFTLLAVGKGLADWNRMIAQAVKSISF